MITQKEVKEMALADMLANLKRCKELAKVVGFGYEIDDALNELRDIVEYEYDESRDS